MIWKKSEKWDTENFGVDGWFAGEWEPSSSPDYEVYRVYWGSHEGHWRWINRVDQFRGYAETRDDAMIQCDKSRVP